MYCIYFLLVLLYHQHFACDHNSYSSDHEPENRWKTNKTTIQSRRYGISLETLVHHKSSSLEPAAALGSALLPANNKLKHVVITAYIQYHLSIFDLVVSLIVNLGSHASLREPV